MAESLATRASRGHRTLCLPIAEESYRRFVGVPVEFRQAIDQCFRRSPELFPANFARGYQLKDDRISAKQGLPIRRLVTRDGVASSVRPSFLMPYLVARVGDVEGPLFLRKFGVPFWALARVFDRDLGHMMERSFGFRHVRSTSALAAPWFVGAALGLDVLSTFYVDQQPFLVGGVTVAHGGGLEGLAMADLSSRTRVIALSRAAGGELEHPPRRGTRFAGGDQAYVLGPYEELLSVLQRDQTDR